MRVIATPMQETILAQRRRRQQAFTPPCFRDARQVLPGAQLARRRRLRQAAAGP